MWCAECTLMQEEFERIRNTLGRILMKKRYRKLFSIVLAVMITVILFACGEKEPVSRDVIDHPWSVTVMGETIPGSYTGTLVEDVPNGTGIFTFSSEVFDVTYSGTWDSGQMNGKGNMRYNGLLIDVGNRKFTGNYSGDAVNGTPNGEGYFICTDPGKEFEYSGAWQNGRPSGKGSLYTDEFRIELFGKSYEGSYSGEVLDMIPNGTGRFELHDGVESLNYEGAWLDGKPMGEGYLLFSAYEVIFSSGTVRVGTYDGTVLDGVASGNGAFTTKNNEGIVYTHTGEWSNGLPNGHGKRKWESNDYYVYQGTFVNGDFVPTPLEYFTTVGTLYDHEYSIADKAVTFLLSHPDIFVNNTIGTENVELEENFKYDTYSKDSSQYGDKLIVIKNLRVVQIFAREQFGESHTMCILQDGAYNVYYVNLYGDAEGIYENNYVTLTALPLDYFTYPNTAGTAIWAIACAGVSINK